MNWLCFIPRGINSFVWFGLVWLFVYLFIYLKKRAAKQLILLNQNETCFFSPPLFVGYLF